MKRDCPVLYGQRGYGVSHIRYANAFYQFRSLVRGHKNDFGFPIVDDGYMLEINILGKTLISIQNQEGLFSRLDDLGNAFNQSVVGVYSKSKTDSYNEKYYLDEITLDSTKITDLRAYRKGGDLYVEINELAQKLGKTVKATPVIKQVYKVE
jgi:galactitol-specific phosphotransferase system IIB component